MNARKNKSAREQLPAAHKTASSTMWKPRSRIAEYIRGNVKLDDIVSRDKIVKPEERHNRRAFLPKVDDDDDTHSHGRVASSRHDSSSYRCNASTVISSKHSSPGLNLLTQALADKNEQIERLQHQVEKFRQCLYLNDVTQDDDIESNVSSLLDCLANVCIIACDSEVSDERLSTFLNRVERERKRWYTYVTSLSNDQQSLRTQNENLQQLNVRKDEQIHEIDSKLKSLQKELDRQTLVHKQKHDELQETNDRLHERLAQFQHVHEEAANQLQILSELGDRLDSEGKLLQKSNVDSAKHAATLENTVQKLIVARLTELKDGNCQKCEANEKQRIERDSEIVSLKHDLNKLTNEKHSLHDENVRLRAAVLELTGQNRTLNERIEEAKDLRTSWEAIFDDWATKARINSTEANEHWTSEWHKIERKRLRTLMQRLEDMTKNLSSLTKANVS